MLKSTKPTFGRGKPLQSRKRRLCQPDREEQRRVLLMDFPIPNYPGKKFPVTLLGIDQYSYGFIHITTSEAWDEYATFLLQLKAMYLKSAEPLPFEHLKEGMFVIARVRRGETKYFVRAEVLSIGLPNQHVQCLNVDEFYEFSVPKEQIYFACPEAQRHPKRAIKMEFNGLSKFLETDLLQKAYGKMDSGIYFMAEMVGRPVAQPILRLVASDGHDMTLTLLQKLYQILPRGSPLLR